MNRQQRRAQGRIQNKQNILQQKYEEDKHWKQVEQEMKQWAQNSMQGLMFTAFYLAIFRKSDLRYKRATRIMNEVDRILEQIASKEITIEQLAQMAKDEAGVVVKFDSDRNIVDLNIFEGRVMKDE